MTVQSNEVFLAVYDLSRGMARNLSAQFLGPQHAIDIIPHTGIVVFGLEYFFGGGIQAVPPDLFRQSMGMFPIQLQSLGRTHVTKVEFEQWCNDMTRDGGRYNAASYDLLSRNCNNFCHDAAIQGLRLSRGVPEWILNVPQRFLASPMGQAVLPMLQNMQVAGNGAVPFADHQAHHHPFADNFNAAAAPPAHHGMPIQNPWGGENPWTNDQPPPQENNNAAARAPVVASPDTPNIDALTKPLLSADNNMMPTCAEKVCKDLTDKDDKTTLSTACTTMAEGKDMSDGLLEAASKILHDVLQKRTNLAFALMILRGLALEPTSYNQPSFVSCMKWLLKQFTSRDGSTALKSPTVKTIAWCVLTNTFGAYGKIQHLERFVDAAQLDVSPDSQPRVEIRQAAVTVLYNASRLQEWQNIDDIPDVVVSMLCVALEGVAEEMDSTTRMRRLMVAGKLIKPDPDAPPDSAVKELIMDLGFLEQLEDATKSEVQGDGAVKCKKLTDEILDILKS